ncbi:hypothetical protein ACFL3A_10930 [Pseudomonadota bacterium]
MRADGNKYFDWLNEIKLNKPSRHDIIISLLNEEHEPVKPAEYVVFCISQKTVAVAYRVIQYTLLQQ